MNFDNLFINVGRQVTEMLGRVCTFTRISITENDTAALEDPDDNEAITFTAYGQLANYSFSEIDNEAVLTTDSKLILSKPETYEPEINDSVTIGNITYRVMNVNPLPCNDTNTAYICQLRA